MSSEFLSFSSTTKNIKQKKKHHKIEAINIAIFRSPERFCHNSIDFLDTLLRYDHADRPTAREAMDHVYFDGIRLTVV